MDGFWLWPGAKVFVSNQHQQMIMGAQICRIKLVISNHKVDPYGLFVLNSCVPVYTCTCVQQCQSIHGWCIDDLQISHNASGMEANIRVLLICNSSSHSPLVVKGMELPCLAATLCLYMTRVARTVRSWRVDAKVNLSKTLTDSLLCDQKFNLFLTFLTRGHQPKYFLKVCS